MEIMTPEWNPSRHNPFYRLFAPKTVVAWATHTALDGPSEIFSNYWMCRAFVDALEETIGSVRWAIQHTRDPRYTHQLYQFHDMVATHIEACQEIVAGNRNFVLTALRREASVSRSHKSNVCCYMGCCVRRRTLDGIKICWRVYQNVMEPFYELVSDHLRLWLRDLHYVRKLIERGQVYIPVPLEGIDLPATRFDDVGSWEVVCSDEEKEILCHPLLPDPSDFLVREHVRGGDSFASKARFEFSFPGSLERHRVVLTKAPSTIPKLLPSAPEKKVVLETTGGNAPAPIGAQGSWRGYARRKRTRTPKHLSRRIKESRKKKKTRHKQRRGWCHARVEPPPTAQEEPDDDDWSDDGWSDYSSYYYLCH